MSLARRTLAALASLLPAIAIAVTYSFWRDGLGSQVAFHWDARGRVDGVIETGGFSDSPWASPRPLAQLPPSSSC